MSVYVFIVLKHSSMLVLWGYVNTHVNIKYFTFNWFNFIFLINLLINKIFQIAEIVSVGTFTNILYCKNENQMQIKQFILVNDLMYYYLYQI